MWSPRIQKAIEVAASAHINHRRKAEEGENLPYMVHLVGVAAILAQAGADEDTVIAGYLHDILEDVPHRYSREDMVRDFGEHITSIVDGVTEDKNIDDWAKRKQKYLDHLEHDSRESLMVSAADLANNLNSLHTAIERMGQGSDAHFSSNPTQRLWFYGERIAKLREKLGDHPVMQTLEAQWAATKPAMESVSAN